MPSRDAIEDALRAAVEAASGSSVRRLGVVRGGDVAASYRADLEDARTLFVKTHPSPPPGFFTTEAAGLEWLREPGAVRVPAVLSVSDGSATAPAHLVLEWVDERRTGPTADAELGRALAELHGSGAPSFGREDRRTTGSRGLPNDPHTTWSGFYATCRLLPLARIAHDAAALPSKDIDALERLAHRLHDHDDGEPPARLHGDLWAGNRIVDRSGHSWLIDPAAHGGHREFDLAMMRLFGGFSAECFRAYDEVHPLRDGWEEQVALHQIAPLVVHAIKFGGGYVRAASAAIARY